MIMGIEFGNYEKADFIRIFVFCFSIKTNYQKHLFLGTVLRKF